MVVHNDDNENSIQLLASTEEKMREIGAVIARYVHGGDVIVLSGPLGAGKTTFAQGFGEGLHVDGPVVSPTFTIARQLEGADKNGKALQIIHVDAYRINSSNNELSHASVDRLLDELESLGLDEALEQSSEDTIVLMEWGVQLASMLAQERLEISIDRTLEPNKTISSELTSSGMRIVTVRAVGSSWSNRILRMRKAFAQ